MTANNAIGTPNVGKRYVFKEANRELARAHQRAKKGERYAYTSGPTASTRSNDASLEIADLEGNLDFSKFADERNLKKALDLLKQKGGLAAGRDGVRIDQVDDSAAFEALRQTSELLISGDYLPQEPLPHPIEKPDGGERVLKIFNWVDRVVAKALYEALKDFWRMRLPDSQLSVPRVLALLHRAIQEGKYFVYLSDIKSCFDQVPTQKVVEVQNEYIKHEKLRFLISRIACGAEGETRLKGVDQGSPYSPTMVQVYLHQTLDLHIMQMHHYVTFLRYADNLVVAAANERECTQAQGTCESLLREAGMELRGLPASVLDLREVHGNPPQLLGYLISVQKGRLTMDIPSEDVDEMMADLFSRHAGVNPRAEQILTGFAGRLGCIPVERANRTLSQVRNYCRLHGIDQIPWRKIETAIQKARE